MITYSHLSRSYVSILSIIALLCALFLLFYNLNVFAAEGSTLTRAEDPVIFTGQSVPSLLGIAPQNLVAFRKSTDTWEQIPVQVDERAMLDLGKAYNQGPVGVPALTYTDPATYIGADPDPTVDGDDEIVFMARDAGGLASSFSNPTGTVGTGVLVTIINPLNAQEKGYVYLFRQDGSLDPSAGQKYVTYNFNLKSGNYLSTYNLQSGPNPEVSTVASTEYNVGFSDRWILDVLKISTGGATNVDILDRYKFMPSPSSCQRTEQTATEGGGAFVANKNGPVRAIRSILGANSGPYTQLQTVFYDRRQDTTNFLRVHTIRGGINAMDYSPESTGMRYYNNNNLNGVLINGVADTVTAGSLNWELVTGAQGSMVYSYRVDTNIPNITQSSYYLDSTRTKQCTGDAYSYGASGPYVTSDIPCTDPRNSCTNTLTRISTSYPGVPAQTVARAQALDSQARSPLQTSFQLFAL